MIYVNGDSLVDDVDCGNGNDTLYHPARANGAAPTAPLRDGLIVNCENVVDRGADAVDPLKGISASIPKRAATKNGTELNDRLSGQHGSDKIRGHGGDDVIWGDQTTTRRRRHAGQNDSSTAAPATTRSTAAAAPTRSSAATATTTCRAAGCAA